MIQTGKRPLATGAGLVFIRDRREVTPVPPMDYLTTANVLLWVFLTVAIYFVFLSHWLVAVSLFPAYVEQCQRQFGRRWSPLSLVCFLPWSLLRSGSP